MFLPRSSSSPRLALIGMALLAVTVPADAQVTGTLFVDAKASIFEAGYAGDSTDGLAPSLFTFTGGENLELLFSSVTGTYGHAGSADQGPDGGPVSFTPNTNSLGGISGVFDNDQTNFLPLVGVFTAGAIPNGTPAPSRLDFTGGFKNQATYTPLLNQTFFIGDGLTGTGSGAKQRFMVPTGATNLYLGFADGVPDPGAYGDNVGALSASFTITGATVLNPENGHYYRLLSEPLTWPQAKAKAESLSYAGGQGYLATITSASEQAFVSSIFGPSITANGPALAGAFQPSGSNEPGGGWQWVTGEAFSYTNWASGEPNNVADQEDVLELVANAGWNDQGSDFARQFTFVEFTPGAAVPEPSTSALIGVSAILLGALTCSRRGKRGG